MRYRWFLDSWDQLKLFKAEEGNDELLILIPSSDVTGLKVPERQTEGVCGQTDLYNPAVG